MRRIVWMVVSCLMALSLVIAACAPAPAAPGAPSTQTAPATPAVPAAPAQPVAQQPQKETAASQSMMKVVLTKLDGSKMEKLMEKPKYGGTLNLLGAIGEDHFNLRNMWIHLGHTTFAETLLHGDWAKGTAGTGEISWQLYEYMTMDQLMPALAERWERPAPDTMVYHLRKGIRFALDEREASRLVGGREVTADDVVWNMKYHFSTTPATRAKGTYGKGVEEADVRATDKYTVAVKAPKAKLDEFVGFISDTLWILPPEIVQKYGENYKWRNLVTTGAFMIKDQIPGSMATFVKNPTYWSFDPVLGEDYRLPYVDSLRYMDVPDRSTRQAAFRTGKLDAVLDATKDESGELLKTASHLKVKIINFGTSSERIAMQMNNPKAPWQDIRVRRALMLGIDHPGIVKSYYGGAADVQAFPLPGAPELYLLGWAIPLKDLPQEVQELYEYHPDKAKQLLKEAGYPNGFKTSLALSSTTAADFYSIIKEMWAKIGVDLTLDIRESGVVSAWVANASYPDMVTDGKWGTATLYNKFGPPPNSMNSANADDPKIHELRTKMIDVFWDREKRTPIMKELYLYTMSQVWYLTLPSPWLYKIYQPWVKNYDAEPSVGYHGKPWRFLWIDQELKKKLGF